PCRMRCRAFGDCHTRARASRDRCAWSAYPESTASALTLPVLPALMLSIACCILVTRTQVLGPRPIACTNRRRYCLSLTEHSAAAACTPSDRNTERASCGSTMLPFDERNVARPFQRAFV